MFRFVDAHSTQFIKALAVLVFRTSRRALSNIVQIHCLVRNRGFLVKLVLPPGHISPPVNSPYSATFLSIAMPKDKDTHSRSSARRTTGDRDLADLGVDPISTDDYFLKSDNFRLWLRKEKGKVRVPISFRFFLPSEGGSG